MIHRVRKRLVTARLPHDQPNYRSPGENRHILTVSRRLETADPSYRRYEKNFACVVSYSDRLLQILIFTKITRVAYTIFSFNTCNFDTVYYIHIRLSIHIPRSHPWLIFGTSQSQRSISMNSGQFGWMVREGWLRGQWVHKFYGFCSQLHLTYSL